MTTFPDVAFAHGIGAASFAAAERELAVKMGVGVGRGKLPVGKQVPN